ncbi:hypothetical protein EW146_g9997 [Bondarzewia mesenterica]|uniref:NmrA-like domain-containing protein n=1 Tax=Bondarzewia mesenterica TaxID=1095465 RepID=A0A4S4L1M4_9AGAM|nr:hypothetical protein EW146_g9997 [Bondarzewia mesenterica]
MSFTTSIGLSRGQMVVAIAGATGNLGSSICPIFLTTPFKVFFSRVVVITRNADTERAVYLASLGAEVHRVPAGFQNGLSSKEALRTALRSVDVLINVLGHTAESERFAGELVDAALDSDVAVYFPSEFGVDHHLNDFSTYDHGDWVYKREYDDRCRNLVSQRRKNMKIIALYVGLFMEQAILSLVEQPISVTPVGFDNKHKIYTSVGSPTQNFTLTSKEDIGRALIAISIRAMSPSEDIPDHLRIAGDTVSFEDVRDTVKRHTGVDVDLRSEDLGHYRSQLKERWERGDPQRPSAYIRAIMGESKLNFSESNDNELINPDQRIWKWKTLDEYVRDHKDDILKAER